MQDESKLAEFELSEADFDRLNKATNKNRVAIWNEIGQTMKFYPTTVEFGDLTTPVIRARPLEKYHTIKDIEEGWSFTDFLSGHGPGENWRIQLNRRLTKLETHRLYPRMQEMGEAPALEDMIHWFKVLCGPDLKMIKARKRSATGEIVTATKIENDWEPVWPEPEDMEIEIQ